MQKYLQFLDLLEYTINRGARRMKSRRHYICLEQPVGRISPQGWPLSALLSGNNTFKTEADME